MTSKRKALYATVFRDVVRKQRRNSMTLAEMKAALKDIYKPFLTAELMREICRLTRLEEESALPKIAECGPRSVLVGEEEEEVEEVEEVEEKEVEEEEEEVEEE